MDQQEDVDEADRLWIRERLEDLQVGELDEKREREIWEGIKKRAPGMFSGVSLLIIRTIIQAKLKLWLGI